ncbi:hypothetical protein NPIL_692711 [Nephila pilipes]|uniref:Uncharacterized protein n=1 Tax=Nephila pilipes TaxID=299642 RepID=A0A8X6QE79_NEPPI|nr:hypothetical protein NPIL_692711 [Nephila pilipes]
MVHKQTTTAWLEIQTSSIRQRRRRCWRVVASRNSVAGQAEGACQQRQPQAEENTAHGVYEASRTAVTKPTVAAQHVCPQQRDVSRYCPPSSYMPFANSTVAGRYREQARFTYGDGNGNRPTQRTTLAYKASDCQYKQQPAYDVALSGYSMPVATAASHTLWLAYTR